MLKALIIVFETFKSQLIPDLSAVFPVLHDSVCSLMLANKPLKPSPMYTEIRLH